MPELHITLSEDDQRRYHDFTSCWIHKSGAAGPALPLLTTTDAPLPASEQPWTVQGSRKAKHKTQHKTPTTPAHKPAKQPKAPTKRGTQCCYWCQETGHIARTRKIQTKTQTEFIQHKCIQRILLQATHTVTRYSKLNNRAVGVT